MAKKNVTSNAAKAAAPSGSKPSTKDPSLAEPVPASTSSAPKKAATKPEPISSGAGVDGTGSNNGDIALRAYFIAENRRLQGLAGDESQDWLDAERQIAAERGTAS